MKHLFLFCLFLIAFSGKTIAQKPAPDSVQHAAMNKHSVYGELLGNTGMGASANYERLLPLNPGKKATLALRVGVGTLLLMPFFEKPILTFPTEVSIFGGKGFFKPEVSCGLTLAKRPSPEPGFGGVMVVRLGLRMQKPGGHFFGRAGLSNWITGMRPEVRGVHVFPFPGLAFGFSF